MVKEQLKFAVVCARGLGDALLSMVLAHNLTLSGVCVTVFSSILSELKEWFPNYQILPFPAPHQFETVFATFDTIIAADHSLINEHHQFGNQLIVLKEENFNKSRTMVENLQVISAEILSLPVASCENGITPPHGVIWRAHPNRVIIHPMSSDVKKNWPAEKFIALGHYLEKEGFYPYFCMCPSERVSWKTSVPEDRLPHFLTISALAAFVYESGYLIGNDSGVGHLASLLNIPTLTLFARKSYSTLWRPGWGPGKVVCPPNILFGSRMKQKYWKNLLSVRRVRKAFIRDLLSEGENASASLPLT